ncbi:hypothetical protein [Flagellimonas algicola]|uniref:Uncharacterized protein n=1 Tax=Flagellimonas algicola TaxID=2583815 RepID=A0ABY2WLG0_9FLAO|nr:hypothetical protein [Allomuricauda algicola]TMU55563.1 hypothetical protein FGG15_15460 [Allomuricauda algicola]
MNKIEMPVVVEQTFELEEENSKTNPKLSYTALEPFLYYIPEFHREIDIAAWDYLIKENLKGFLEAKKRNNNFTAL